MSEPAGDWREHGHFVFGEFVLTLGFAAVVVGACSMPVYRLGVGSLSEEPRSIVMHARSACVGRGGPLMSRTSTFEMFGRNRATLVGQNLDMPS